VSPQPDRISLVVLAKESRTAKTRLSISRPAADRTAQWLAAATARTALRARSVDRVLVVTSDEAIGRDAAEAGAQVVAEGRPLGMNRAAALGRQHALLESPAAAVGILVADLPRLQAGDLDEVVAEFHERRCPLFVADHHGVGTTFLIHGPDNKPGIGFGRSSAHMHARLGYEAPERQLRGLRLDLDTTEDLKEILRCESGMPLNVMRYLSDSIVGDNLALRRARHEHGGADQKPVG
jgi:2-phospho-L-lactate/phosphoenolpyruvate guanylyltransferase